MYVYTSLTDLLSKYSILYGTSMLVVMLVVIARRWTGICKIVDILFTLDASWYGPRG